MQKQHFYFCFVCTYFVAMQITYISADWIFPVSSAPIEKGTLGYTPDGSIEHVLSAASASEMQIEVTEHFKGVLIPGLINTHCHLELSHMRNKLEEKTGLPNFIKGILSQRQQPEAEIMEAMQKADEEMYQNGIVAVGDISNVSSSKAVKLNSKIYYHTFVEVFGFNRPSAPIIEAGLQLVANFAPLKANLVPHAPYSVSSALFKEIKTSTTPEAILSIHNQETVGENELFKTGTGAFADFFADMGIAQSEAHNTGQNAIQYHLPQLPKNVNTLLVHNTMSEKADIDFAKANHQHLYWCMCPNANLYIENALPDLALWKAEKLQITLGTDSLASNHQLNILAEMQTLQDQKQISFLESLAWATLNGAKFLNIADQYGSLEKGKKPGILWLSLDETFHISAETKLKRII
jgi:cytosine/adenosine deaminase-related metal-dependent hydrolase